MDIIKHPNQPTVMDPNGVVRFKSNLIVKHLLDDGPYDMNKLATMGFSEDDRSQFAQLIGYSVSGYNDLSYAIPVSESDEVKDLKSQIEILKAEKDVLFERIDMLIKAGNPMFGMMRAIDHGLICARDVCRNHERWWKEAKKNDPVAALEAEVARLKGDLEVAAGDYPVEFPEPGTPMATLLSANVLLRRKNAALQAERDELARRCALAEAYLAARASSPWKLEEADSEEAARRITLDWRGISPDDKVCTKCGGSGVRVYGSTSTWHGGTGGQQLTSDICDRCWGSGAENRPWLNLRNHARALAEAQKGGRSD